MKQIKKINPSRLRVGEQISFYETVNSYVNLYECKEVYQLNKLLSDGLNNVTALRNSHFLNDSRSRVKQTFNAMILSWRGLYNLTSALVISGRTPQSVAQAQLLKRYFDANTKPLYIAQEQAAGIILDQIKYISQDALLSDNEIFVNQAESLNASYKNYVAAVQNLINYKAAYPGGSINKSLLQLMEVYRQMVIYIESYYVINNAENYSKLIDMINIYITKISYRLTVSQAAADINNVEPQNTVA